MGEVGFPAVFLRCEKAARWRTRRWPRRPLPGQVSLHELKHLYRAHELNRRTQVFGVIGDPIGHSLSPLMHNSAFVAKKVNAVYLPFLVQRPA